jgi:rod shape-determining protein MreD
MKPGKPLLPQGTAIVAPPSWRVLLLTLVLAFLLTLMPWPGEGRWLVPDFALMVLLYWNIHVPRPIGLGAAFLLGLLTDAAGGVLIGQHALSYTLAAFVILSLRRRLEKFPPLGRALQVAPVLFGQIALVLLLGLLFDRQATDWRYLASGVTAALLWLPLAWLLDALTGHVSPLPGAGLDERK